MAAKKATASKKKTAAKPDVAPAPPEMMTIAQAATLLMVTPQWVRDLAKQGAIPKPVSGMVPQVATIQGYIKWLKDEDRRSSKSASASRVQDARAREIEIRSAKEEGSLIDIEDVEITYEEILGAYRSELAGIPAGVTRDLALRAVIESRLNDAIARCRARFQAASASVRQGGGFSVGDEAAIP